MAYEVLFGVAATSACNAWAVGGPLDTALLEHWNGKSWTVQKRPRLSVRLFGVTAVSARDAWTVGYCCAGTQYRSLVGHWNGRAWNVQKIGRPGRAPVLDGVAATSRRNAWAVGASSGVSLVEHWNGKAWNRQHSPNPGSLGGGINWLNGVAATSATNAWAVGLYINNAYSLVERTLVEHWNGKAWSKQDSPNPGCVTCRYGDALDGVAATSATNAWAVGTSSALSLVEHWNGKAWKVQKSPHLDGSLFAVAAVSASDAWAVGDYITQLCKSCSAHDHGLIEHWNGKAWKVQKSPNPRNLDTFLLGVAATSATNAWAVGSSSKGTLIEHWNGKTWAR